MSNTTVTNLEKVSDAIAYMSALSCYFNNGGTIDEMYNAVNTNPDDVYGSEDILDSNIELINDHIKVNNKNDFANKFDFIIKNADLTEEQLKILKDVYSINIDEMVSKILDADNFKNAEDIFTFISNCKEFVENPTVKSLNKEFRNIISECDIFVRSIDPTSSINNVNDFKTFLEQAKQKWYEAFVSVNTSQQQQNAIFQTASTRIATLEHEVNSLNSQIDEKNKIIKELEDKINSLSSLQKGKK